MIVTKLIFFLAVLAKRFRKLEAPLIIYGSPRGGTTWIADLIRADKEIATVYEPFGLYVPEMKKRGAYRCLDIADSVHEKAYLRHFKALIYRSKIEPSCTIPDEKIKLIFAKRSMVKCIKAHYNVAWFARHFSEMKFIVLFRNPYAVIASQLSYGNPSQFYLSPHEENDHSLVWTKKLEPYRALVEGCVHPEEKLCLAWCLSTKEMLEQIKTLASGSGKVLFYEDMIKQPMKHWEALKKEYDLTHITAPDFDQLSYSALDGTSSDFMTKWRKKLSTVQIENIDAVLKACEMLKYYSEDGLPGEVFRASIPNHFMLINSRSEA